jgi:hypothetical protein
VALLAYQDRQSLEKLVDTEAERKDIGVQSYQAPYKARGWKMLKRLEVMAMKGHSKIHSTASGEKVKKWARKWIKEVLEEVQVQQVYAEMADHYGWAEADMIKAKVQQEEVLHPYVKKLLKAQDKKCKRGY